MVEVRAHRRNVIYSVDAEKALQLFEFGSPLEEIRQKLNPAVSLATVSRSIQRARREREQAE
jgi:hypothetical protein